MQDQRELGGAAGQGLPLRAFLSDLPEQGGGVSLRQVSKDSGAPERQSGDAVEWARLRCALPPRDGEARTSGGSCEGLSTSTARGPDPGEHSGAWGEFEVFQESSASSEQFSQSFELQERPAASQPWRTASAQKEHGSSQRHQGGVTGTGAIAASEVFLKSWPCCTGSVSYPVVGWSGRGPLVSGPSPWPLLLSVPSTFLSAHSPSAGLCFPGPSSGHVGEEHFV